MYAIRPTWLPGTIEPRPRTAQPPEGLKRSKKFFRNFFLSFSSIKCMTKPLIQAFIKGYKVFRVASEKLKTSVRILKSK